MSIQNSNSVSGFVDSEWERYKVKVASDGTVHWLPGGRMDTSCSMVTQTFPFDKQTCRIQLGTCTSNMHDIRFNAATTDTSFYNINGEWDLTNTTAFTSISGGTIDGNHFSGAKFQITLRRRSLYYVLNLIVPCMLLSLLSGLAFLVPVDAGEKISLIITLLLSFTVFLMVIADRIPKTSVSTPLFCK